MRRVRGQCEESWGMRHAKSCFSLSACASVSEDVRRNARTPTHTLTDEDESVRLSAGKAFPHSHAASFRFSALARQKEPRQHKHGRRRCRVRLVAKHLVEAANTNPITSVVSSYCVNAWSLVSFSSTENMKYCPPQHIYFIRIWFGWNTFWRHTGCFLKGHKISCITWEKYKFSSLNTLKLSKKKMSSFCFIFRFLIYLHQNIKWQFQKKQQIHVSQ